MMQHAFGDAGTWPDRLDRRQMRSAAQRAVRYRGAMVRLMWRRLKWTLALAFDHPDIRDKTWPWPR